jgi:glycogen(starch) synthase
MANEETDREPREVKNHVLFEIATEVAHRGTLGAPVARIG